MTTWLCPYIAETPHSDVLLTTLAAFTLVFGLIRLLVDNFKGTQNPAGVLLYEFYGQNPTAAYLIDLLLILAFFAVTLTITQTGWGQDWGNGLLPTVRFFLTLALVILVLDLLIKFLADAMTPNNPGAHYLQFFKRWGDTMGFKAVIWDWIYLGLVALITFCIIASGMHKWLIVVAIFWVMVACYFLTISEQ
jgi:hypothetical protein